MRHSKITNDMLKRMLRTYTSDNYNLEPIATGDLMRLAYDRIVDLEKEVKQVREHHRAVERVRQATSGTRWEH